jgi:hypothetical protein
MTKKELIAAIREVDDTKTVSALKKENAADLALLLEELTKPSVKKSPPFREREEVKVHIDSFKTNRNQLFQPAIYRRDDKQLEVALRTLINDIQDIASASGVVL